MSNALSVHERAVGALQIHDFQIVAGGGYPAVQPRHERGIEDEVGARRAADGLDGAGTQAKRVIGLGAPQSPHCGTFYPPGRSTGGAGRPSKSTWRAFCSISATHPRPPPRPRLRAHRHLHARADHRRDHRRVLDRRRRAAQAAGVSRVAPAREHQRDLASARRAHSDAGGERAALRTLAAAYATFESMAQYIVLPANLTGAGDAAQIAGRAHQRFDSSTCCRCRRRGDGRSTPGDEPSDAPEVAVITDACWRQRFGCGPGHRRPDD